MPDGWVTSSIERGYKSTFTVGDMKPKKSESKYNWDVNDDE